VAPTRAAADTFTVDSTGDAPNTSIGGGCEAELGKCTLRAAIEAADQRPGLDTVTFDPTVFTGVMAGTIDPATELPPITDPLSIIDGCPTTEPRFPFGTCAGLDASGLATGFEVESDEVSIDGLAITGATIGIDVTSSADEFAASRDRLGADLSDAAGPNGTGIRLGPGSDDDRIGADSIVYNTEVGLDLEGASRAEVRSSIFGILGGRAPNGTDIEISDVSTGGRVVKAADNEIGAKKFPFASVSPGCSGGCNVIAGAVVDGIDLGGDGGMELPASGPTTILGNVFGATGSGLGFTEAAVPNGHTSIVVGSAAEVTIGGPLPRSEGNYFVGGHWAVTAGHKERELAIEGNFVGRTTTEYPDTLEPPSDGAFSTETWESGTYGPMPRIAGNVIWLRGGVGILDAGGPAAIAENHIDGSDTGIRVEGERSQFGAFVMDNQLLYPGEFGIDVRNYKNSVIGNFVFGATKAGVRVESPGWTGGTEDYIGGTEAEEENEIEYSGGPAVEVVGEDTAFVGVLRNVGKGNGGPFIDLGGDGPGNSVDGPNEGIQAPTIQSATPTEVSGDGALGGGSRIRVFLKAKSEPGEIEEYLTSTTATEHGFWSVALPRALPVGAFLGVTQTAYWGTSEMAIASVTAQPSVTPSSSSAGSPAAAATVRARILAGPPSTSTRKHVSFRIASSTVGGKLECSLDGAPFLPCHSPRTYLHLEPGRHTFRVRAVGADGAVDETPAVRTFRILRSTKSRRRLAHSQQPEYPFRAKTAGTGSTPP
jgi:CSLREA domain-containing protein